MNNNISVAALQQGDRAEFSRMVDAYSGALYRLAYQLLGKEEDAEDVLQNTFLQAYKNLNLFEGRSSLSTWLYRIASNEALMLLRKRKPEVAIPDNHQEEGDLADYAPVELSDWCCLPEEELLSSETRQALNNAISLLPETLRIVFLLRDVEGLSIQETSDALSLTEAAVKTRLLRARLRLRENISQYFSERVRSESK